MEPRMGGVVNPRGNASVIAPISARRVARRWVRMGWWLVAGTLTYNVVEAGIALWAGERADSVALLGFGIDSVIEIAAAAVVLWRMTVELRTADGERVVRAETRVRRFVAVTFFGLAAYVMIESGWMLVAAERPAASVPGIILAGASLVVMPLIALGKFGAAAAIGSRALRAEAKETLACSYLSVCLLVGLGANAAAGWWWADPVAAMLMVPWLVREGVEGFEHD